jgi:hypothetical protein
MLYTKVAAPLQRHLVLLPKTEIAAGSEFRYCASS